MSTAGPVVLDTNIVLDLLVFHDPATLALADALASGALAWHATVAMREELQRVLAYPALQAWLGKSGANGAEQVLARFDSLSRVHVEVAGGAARCRDPDDQKFIDLALHCGAQWLLSHDRAVLKVAHQARRRGLLILPADRWVMPTAN